MRLLAAFLFLAMVIFLFWTLLQMADERDKLEKLKAKKKKDK